MPEQVHLDEVIAKLIADGASGALEVRDGKKRWLFFFSGGALVYTRSNLKSEQIDAIRAKVGDRPTNELIRLQAVRRIRNACRAASATQSFHDGANPPQVTPVNAPGALIEAVAAAYDDESIRARTQPIVSGWPRVVADLGGLGIDPGLERYLQDVDGGRPGSDVADFAPAPPAMVHAALLVLWQLDELTLDESASMSTEVVGVGEPSTDPVLDDAAAEQAIQPPPPEAPAASAGALDDDLDLGAIMADALADVGDVSPAPPPAPAADDDDSLTRPMPRGGGGEHPLAARLQELAARIEGSSNHFQILDIPWQSEVEDIRLAYTALARELHPDRFHDGPEELREQATELFDRLRQAWEVLSNQQSRQEHINVAIHGKKSAEEEAREQLERFWAADDAFRRGLTLFRNGRVKAAHTHFKQATDAVPDQLEFQAYFGYTKFATSKQSNPATADEGLALLRDALERNKSQERQLDGGWVLLGRAYRQRGEFDTARRALIHALRINPANQEASREMKRLEREMGIGSDKKKGGFLASLFKR